MHGVALALRSLVKLQSMTQQWLCDSMHCKAKPKLIHLLQVLKDWVHQRRMSCAAAQDGHIRGTGHPCGFHGLHSTVTLWTESCNAAHSGI